MNYAPEFAVMADRLFYVYLLWVSCQDAKEMQVVRYSHLTGILAIVIKLICYSIDDIASGDSLGNVCAGRNIVVILVGAAILSGIQYMSCRQKLYGVADGIVFWVGGMFLLVERLGVKGAAEEMVFSGLTAFFMMQALSGLLLILVQAAKGNIKSGIFKQSIAYIPYISVAFFLTKGVL